MRTVITPDRYTLFDLYALDDHQWVTDDYLVVDVPEALFGRYVRACTALFALRNEISALVYRQTGLTHVPYPEDDTV